jgi:hypothetical protein
VFQPPRLGTLSHQTRDGTDSPVGATWPREEDQARLGNKPPAGRDCLPRSPPRPLMGLMAGDIATLPALALLGLTLTSGASESCPAGGMERSSRRKKEPRT